MVMAPNGTVAWVKDGVKRWVGSDIMLNCVRVRGGAGNPIDVSQATWNAIQEGPGAYCPYPVGSLVREASASAVYYILPNGQRVHVSGAFMINCQHGEYLNGVPNGELAGHVVVGWQNSFRVLN